MKISEQKKNQNPENAVNAFDHPLSAAGLTRSHNSTDLRLGT
jgi:hypothetical protein